MNGLYARLIAGVMALGVVLALGLSLKVNGIKTAEIKSLKADLVAASKALTQASKDIERFSRTEGVVAAEAARLCAAEGSTAFGRGVEVGIAVCEARK